MSKVNFGLVSGVLFLVAFVPYFTAIVLGGGAVAPSPITWLIYAVVDTLVFFAMKKAGSNLGQISGAVIGAWTTLVLALVYGGIPTMGAIEWVSVTGAVVGMSLWAITGSPTTAIVCTQAALFIGSFPTFTRGYYTPEKEDPIAWTIWLVSCIFALMAIKQAKKKWNLDNALQPLTFTAIETIMVVLVVIRPML